MMKAIGFEEQDRFPIWDYVDDLQVRDYFTPRWIRICLMLKVRTT